MLKLFKYSSYEPSKWNSSANDMQHAQHAMILVITTTHFRFNSKLQFQLFHLRSNYMGIFRKSFYVLLLLSFICTSYALVISKNENCTNGIQGVYSMSYIYSKIIFHNQRVTEVDLTIWSWIWLLSILAILVAATFFVYWMVCRELQRLMKTMSCKVK